MNNTWSERKFKNFINMNCKQFYLTKYLSLLMKNTHLKMHFCLAPCNIVFNLSIKVEECKYKS